MAERAKGSGPEWNGLRTGPVTSFFDTSRSTPGDLLSQPNSDQPSDLISGRDTYLALAESETPMPLSGDSDGYENAKERWESDRTGQKMVHRNEDDDDRVGWSRERNRYSFGLLPE